mmetsp:Transcript_3036/g.6444  ORF Transcript_3036/g.6444 Transcript_3036/m.6444 type:complete len:393 (-) Transcript_3036:1942-3120(-)
MATPTVFLLALALARTQAMCTCCATVDTCTGIFLFEPTGESHPLGAPQGYSDTYFLKVASYFPHSIVYHNQKPVYTNLRSPPTYIYATCTAGNWVSSDSCRWRVGTDYTTTSGSFLQSGLKDKDDLDECPTHVTGWQKLDSTSWHGDSWSSVHSAWGESIVSCNAPPPPSPPPHPAHPPLCFVATPGGNPGTANPDTAADGHAPGTLTTGCITGPRCPFGYQLYSDDYQYIAGAQPPCGSFIGCLSCDGSCSAGNRVQCTPTPVEYCDPPGCHAICPGFQLAEGSWVPCDQLATPRSPPSPPPVTMCSVYSPGTSSTSCSTSCSGDMSIIGGVTTCSGTLTCFPTGCSSECPGYVAAGYTQEPCASPPSASHLLSPPPVSPYTALWTIMSGS